MGLTVEAESEVTNQIEQNFIDPEDNSSKSLSVQISQPLASLVQRLINSEQEKERENVARYAINNDAIINDSVSTVKQFADADQTELTQIFTNMVNDVNDSFIGISSPTGKISVSIPKKKFGSIEYNQFTIKDDELAEARIDMNGIVYVLTPYLPDNYLDIIKNPEYNSRIAEINGRYFFEVPIRESHWPPSIRQGFEQYMLNEMNSRLELNNVAYKQAYKAAGKVAGKYYMDIATKVGIDKQPNELERLFAEANLTDAINISDDFLQGLIGFSDFAQLDVENYEEMIRFIKNYFPDSHWDEITPELFRLKDPSVSDRDMSQTQALKLKIIVNHLTWKAGQDERASFERSLKRVRDKNNYQDFDGMLTSFFISGMIKGLEHDGLDVPYQLIQARDSREMSLMKQALINLKATNPEQYDKYCKHGRIRAGIELFKDLAEPTPLTPKLDDDLVL